MKLWPTIILRQSASPRGAVIEGEEAQKVIDVWEDKLAVIEKKGEAMVNAVPLMQQRVREHVGKIKEIALELKEAKKHYSEVSTPIAKERWARRLVHASSTLDYLNEARNTMQVNIERGEAAIEDAQSIGRLLVEKITDARLYFQLNGQIRLVGNALAAAEKVYERSAAIEHDFEISAEGLEKMVTRYEGKDLIAEADKLLGIMGHVSES